MITPTFAGVSEGGAGRRLGGAIRDGLSVSVMGLPPERTSVTPFDGFDNRRSRGPAKPDRTGATKLVGDGGVALGVDAPARLLYRDVVALRAVEQRPCGTQAS